MYRYMCQITLYAFILLFSCVCRLVATGIYLFFMGLTLFLAFYKGDIPVRLLWLVLSIFCQFLALIWYTLSYIPFAREIAYNMCHQTCCKGLCPAQVSTLCMGTLCCQLTTIFGILLFRRRMTVSGRSCKWYSYNVVNVVALA